MQPKFTPLCYQASLKTTTASGVQAIIYFYFFYLVDDLLDPKLHLALGVHHGIRSVDQNLLHIRQTLDLSLIYQRGKKQDIKKVRK